MADCKKPTSSQISTAITMDDIDEVLVWDDRIKVLDDITDDWI